MLILLLHQWLPFDNALAALYPGEGVPKPLEKYDAASRLGTPSMFSYLDGLYLLAPFYQACQEGLPSGLYRLEEIASDQFSQCEYFLSYFHDNVLEDEVRFVLQLPAKVVLCDLTAQTPDLIHAVRYSADRVTLRCSPSSFAFAHSRRRR